MVRTDLKSSLKIPKEIKKVLPIEAIYVVMVRKEENYTNRIVELAKEEIIMLEKWMGIIEEFQKDEPAGCLKYQKKRDKTFYYYQFFDESKEGWNRKYLKREELPLVKRLAQKQYYSLVKPVIENNLNVLRRLVKGYQTEGIEKVYDNLSEERRGLITPLYDSIKEKIYAWNNERYAPNPSHPETLRYLTEQGEVVRSKSEWIIANELFKYREDILYKYERPITIWRDGMPITIHPDFTILNIHTGKIRYWEHAGLLDNPQYARDTSKRLNDYVNNGYMMGRDVIISSETSENPLDIGVIKKMVEDLARER